MTAAVMKYAPLAPLAVWLALANPLRAGEVYKSIDADGHVVYSDHADPAAPKKPVQVDAPTPQTIAKNAKIQARLRAEDLARRKQQAIAAAKMAKLDHDAQVQCDAARDRFYSMKESSRLLLAQRDGNRADSSDAESAMKREVARQAMVIACTD